MLFFKAWKIRNTEAFCVRSKVLFLVPFGCHILMNLLMWFDSCSLFYFKEVGTWRGMVATVEKQTGSRGHRGLWMADPSSLCRSHGIQAAGGFVSWQTRRPCGSQQLLRFPDAQWPSLSWAILIFFSKKSFQTYQKEWWPKWQEESSWPIRNPETPRAKDRRARRSERKADVYTGTPLKERFSRLTFLPKEMSLSLVHTAPSPHIWTMVPSLRRCRFHSENERQAVSHELVSFPSFFFLVRYSVVGLTSVHMCAGTCVCLHVHLHMEVRDQLWLLLPRNHLQWFFFFFSFLSFCLIFI